MDFNSDVRVTDLLFSTSRIPHIVWEYYLEYLWYYQPESYVARIASTFRVLAVVITIPVVILALLDISSYVIARTLGVVEVAKASTSDKTSAHKQEPPTIHVDTGTPTDSSALSLSEIDSHNTPRNTKVPDNHNTADKLHDNHQLESSFLTQEFFAAEDKLSGVGVFSPAASQPPSPTLSRRDLQMEPKGVENVLEDILSLRRRVGKSVEENGSITK